ncbi:MAG TPA: hypothetical protein VN815_00800 [Steroidobacteraceae bacterium]|nr:hypothetical protein [Steroidobacteraceae bacterium]
MSAALSALLGLIGQLIPLITSSANATLIDSIINTLEGFLPFIIQEVEALYQPVKNIIAALSANPATTASQLAALQAQEAQIDAAFDAAAASTDAGT